MLEKILVPAQMDMRRGYLSGAPGVFASALAWLTAACTAAWLSPERAIWVLLVGGALIHPASLLICRVLGAPGAHAKANPLGPLAAASTFWLIFSLPLAYGLGLQQPAWFFAAMLLVIGGRYLVFATVYGLRLYWTLGLTLAGAGVAIGWLKLSPTVAAFGGAGIELAFAGMLAVQHRARARFGAADESAEFSATR